MKTFLKVCPDCGTEKKRHQRTCEKCGYDFVENKVYSVEDDIRKTNEKIREYLRDEKRRKICRSIGNILAVGAVCAIGIYCYVEEVFEEK